MRSSVGTWRIEAIFRKTTTSQFEKNKSQDVERARKLEKGNTDWHKTQKRVGDCPGPPPFGSDGPLSRKIT